MVAERLASVGGMERGWIAEVLLHNGGFFNACTMKRCLHRKVDFKTNELKLCSCFTTVSLQSRIFTKRWYYYILADQNKPIANGYKSQNNSWPCVISAHFPLYK
jgi:hypothetical protein